MLPSGLQPPLLWLLLWMPELGLSSPLSMGKTMTSPVHEDWPSLYNRVLHRVTRNTTEKNPKTGDGFNFDFTTVRMVDINNEIYEQFQKRRNNVYMVFNKAKLRKAIPDPSLLFRAKLHLRRRKRHQEQLVLLFERSSNNSWHYLNYHYLAQGTAMYWLCFDVTEVVLRWLNQTGPIEVFGLNRISLVKEEENALHMDFRGLTPNDRGDQPEKHSRNRPFLILLTTQPEHTQPVNSSSTSET